MNTHITFKAVKGSQSKGLDPLLYEYYQNIKTPIHDQSYSFKGFPIGNMRANNGYPTKDLSYNVSTHERMIDNVRTRYYEKGATKQAVFFIHGGGFTCGSIDQHDNVCKYLTENANVTVISIDYALAPESPFPQGLQDCLATVEFIMNEQKYDSYAIIGESAGGNYAISVARRMIRKQLDLLVLFYPVVSLLKETDENGLEWDINQYNIIDEQCETCCRVLQDSAHFYQQVYLQNQENPRDPSISPIFMNDFEDFPRTLMITAEYDYLRLEDEKFFQQLLSHEISAELIQYNGMNHAFLDKFAYFWQGEDALKEISKRLINIRSNIHE